MYHLHHYVNIINIIIRESKLFINKYLFIIYKLFIHIIFILICI